ncbi:MAG: F0F1 ATP synthase subunit B' [Oscillatoriales cyanobacterium]|nr:MAG: F0F1 ATP synthase subunit B' [Oscillatoriales cyanobacterium]
MLYALVPTLLAAEAEGGLFDLDATLPLMAAQFLILALILNAVLYKPLGQAIDQRADYIRGKQLDAQERLDKVKALTADYERALADARRQSQSIVADAQAEAQKLAAQAVAEAQRQAQAEREAAQQEIDNQRQSAMAALDGQVAALSRQIATKLLGFELG